MIIGNAISPFSPVVTGGASFSIANSFLLDGVNEFFTTPSADLVSTLRGTVEATLNFVIKPDSGISNSIFWANGATTRGIYMTYETTPARVGVSYFNGSSATRFTYFPVSAITLGVYNFLSISIDNVNGEIKLKKNGSEISSTSSSSVAQLKEGVIAGTDDFLFGSNTFGFNYYEGYLNQISVIGKVMSLAEHVTWYNSGAPLDSQAQFGSDCVAFFNPDTSGSTAQFTMTDSVNSVTSVSSNMEDADKTTDTPY